MSQRSKESHVITPRDVGKIESKTERNKSVLVQQWKRRLASGHRGNTVEKVVKFIYKANLFPWTNEISKIIPVAKPGLLARLSSASQFLEMILQVLTQSRSSLCTWGTGLEQSLAT